jgi:hypothetical protein
MTTPLSMIDTEQKPWAGPFDSDFKGCPELRAERVTTLTFMSRMIDETPDCAVKWQWAFALGTTNCLGRTIEDVAARSKLEPMVFLRATLALCKRLAVHPSPFLRRAALPYRKDTRKEKS